MHSLSVAILLGRGTQGPGGILILDLHIFVATVQSVNEDKDTLILVLFKRLKSARVTDPRDN